MHRLFIFLSPELWHELNYTLCGSSRLGKWLIPQGNQWMFSKQYSHHIILWNGNVQWPARSPDLNASLQLHPPRIP
jgi:hypothetical protein